MPSQHFNFLRKPASDWGWDWGPAFAPSGIQGEVQLLALSTAYLAGGGEVWSGMGPAFATSGMQGEVQLLALKYLAGGGRRGGGLEGGWACRATGKGSRTRQGVVSAG